MKRNRAIQNNEVSSRPWRIGSGRVGGTGLALLSAALLLASTAGRADAVVIINVTEVGSDVVFSAGGSLDLTGASLFSSATSYGQGFISGGANWYVAPGLGGATVQYALTTADGPFGTSSSFQTPPSSASGDNFYIWGQNGLIPSLVGLPVGYNSGDAISSGMVFNSATIAGLSMTPGTYNYTLPNDTITLNIAAVSSSVPEGGSTLVMLGLAMAGIARFRRKGI